MTEKKTETTTKHKSWTSAVTFAEAGEWEIAREMIPDILENREISSFSKTYMAAAFAEEGMPEEALRIMDAREGQSRQREDFMEKVGLRGIRMTYGVLAVDVNR